MNYTPAVASGMQAAHSRMFGPHLETPILGLGDDYEPETVWAAWKSPEATRFLEQHLRGQIDQTGAHWPTVAYATETDAKRCGHESCRAVPLEGMKRGAPLRGFDAIFLVAVDPDPVILRYWRL